MAVALFGGIFNQAATDPHRRESPDTNYIYHRKSLWAASGESGGTGADGPVLALATPTSPGTVTSFGPSGQEHIDHLLYGVKWGTGGAGTGAALTYSFGTSESFYSATYANGEPSTGFGALSPVQTTAVENALSAWAELADVRFTRVIDSAAVAGDLRFAKSSAPQTAWAYMPGPFTEAGDVWISHNSAYETATPGSYGYFAVLHEIGHALGLTHTHIATGISKVADPAIDTTAFSIMSYRSYEGAPLTGYKQSFFPDTPMLHDVAAIQHIYGANPETRAGDDVYRWERGERLLQTLWDAGGDDTIDWSNQLTAATIDLNPGAWSELGPAYWTGADYDSRTLAIAYGATIENAIGGAGDDRLIGNDAGNLLRGSGGADQLDGGASDDRLEGGIGNDLLFGGAGEDLALFAGQRLDYDILSDDGIFTVRDLDPADGDEGEDRLSAIERLEFQDGIFNLFDNTAPQALDDQYVGRQGEELVVAAADGLLGNDSDADGHSLSAQLLQDVANGALTLDPDGSFRYVPNPGFSGADGFSYSISDGHGGSDTATVSLTIEPTTPPSQGPVAIDDEAATFAGQRIAISVLGNDLARDGGGLRIEALGEPEHGSVRANGSATKITYMPDRGFSGSDSFTYTVADGTGGSDTATVTVNVHPGAPADWGPIAVDDRAVAEAGGRVTIQVLGNDVDGGGDRLRIAAFEQPANGTVQSTNSATKLFYRPNAGFSGSDSFSYTATNEDGTTDMATVTITVLPAGGAPAVAGPTGKDAIETMQLSAGELLQDPSNDIAMFGPAAAPPYADAGSASAFLSPAVLKDIFGDDTGAAPVVG